MNPLTVRELLEFEAMRDAEVLAGHEGLGREVTGANVVEVPDVHTWLRGGEVLFTAGYAWRDEPEGLVEILEELNRVGVSALGIKIGTYLEEIPEGLEETANDLKLPLIRIPATLPYGDIIDPLYRRLATQRLWLLERSLQIQETLVSLGLDHQSIEKTTGALTREVGSPAYVVDLVDDTIVFADEDGRITRRSKEDLSRDEAVLVEDVNAAVLGRVPARMNLGGRQLLAVALTVAGGMRGQLVVLQERRQFDEFTEIAVAHAAELLSFLIMRQMAIIEGRREAGDLFLDSLLSDDLSNEEATERALALGLRLSRPCVALVVGTDSPTDREHGDSELAIAAGRALGPLPHVLSADKDVDGLFILAQPSESEEFSIEDMIARLQRMSLQRHRAEITIGAGSPLKGLDGVRRSRLEALLAYQVGRRQGVHGLIRFSDLGVERILAQIPEGALSLHYVESKLGALEGDEELLRTLEVYLEYGGNKVATAKAVPLHRSSLVYRLEKISRLIGADVDDPEERFELWLALRLRRIIGLGRQGKNRRSKRGTS